MAHHHAHLTPEELATEEGLQREEVLVLCVGWGVPVYRGRIDRTLFAAARDQHQPRTRHLHAVA